jgi:hypothetical protein
MGSTLSQGGLVDREELEETEFALFLEFRLLVVREARVAVVALRGLQEHA